MGTHAQAQYSTVMTELIRRARSNFCVCAGNPLLSRLARLPLLRRILLALLVQVTLASGCAHAQDILRGKLKRLDVESRSILVTIDGQDRELALSDATQVPGGRGRDLAERFRGFTQGSDVLIRLGEHEGRRIVQGIALAGPGQRLQETGRNTPQRAKVKNVDAGGRTITLVADGRDLVLTLTDQTQFRGTRTGPLAERLKEFEPGAEVIFVAELRNGRSVLVGIMSASTESLTVAQSPGAPNQPVSLPHSELKPLDELGLEKYRGYPGGLYPDGKNVRPAQHEAAGVKLAAQIQPLDERGNPDAAGRIALVSIGMSNTSQASQGFQAALLAYEGKNPRLVFVNGAVDGLPAEVIQNPNDGGQGARYWAELDVRLRQVGVTRAQVQAFWIKQADPGVREGFPDYARRLQSELTRIVQILPHRFPNAKLVYLSSRTYGGYATSFLNPEPHAYESGFSVKWLIEEQIRGSPVLNYDSSGGAVAAPWISWGPYLWANGIRPRSTDGLRWERLDFGDDGTHESASGQRKVGRLLLDFFKNDVTSRHWFNRK